MSCKNEVGRLTLGDVWYLSPDKCEVVIKVNDVKT